MNTKKIRIICKFFQSILIFIIIILFDLAIAQDSLLNKGIEQYEAENYEEALEILNNAYRNSPSTTVYFYLGLTHKRMGEFKKAKEFFIKSLTETPRINDAYLELAHTLYQLDEFDAAEKWLQEAKEQKIMPAKIAFIEGLILIEKGQFGEARKSFEKAKKLDPNLKQSADFQISLTYLLEKKIKEAKNSFEALIEVAPGTEVSEFAKDYLFAIDGLVKSHKEWNINYSIEYLYDDNVVLKPSGIIGIEAVDKISGKRDNAVVNKFKITYRPSLPEKFYFSGSYEFYYKNYFNTYEYDMMIHSIELNPGYNFKSGIIIFPLSYYHLWLNEREYMSLFYFRPTINFQFLSNHIAQFSLGYGKRDLLKYIRSTDEDRDSNQFLILIGYIQPFKDDKGVFYTRYEYIYDNTEGKNWDSDSHKLSLGIVYPLFNAFTLNFACDYTWQNYKNINSYSTMSINGFPGKETKRKDNIYNISAGFGYEISKFYKLNLKYIHTRNDSNFPIYDYTRNLYSIELFISF